MRRIAFACVVVLAAAIVFADVNLRAGQALKLATGLIVGRVVEATTGAPVRGAVVRIFGSRWGEGATYPGVMTDGEGQFVISGVPAGGFRLFATKFGYADGALGRRRPNPDEPDPEPLVLAAGERRGDVTIRIWKHAAITGAVVDEFGEPAVGVTVRAFPRVFVAGRPKLGANGQQQALTDDRGIYRLPRLVAGDYIVAIIRSETAIPESVVAQMTQVSRSGDRSAEMAMFMDLERAGLSMPRLGDSGHIKVGTSAYGLGTPPIAPQGDRLMVYPSQYYGGTSQISTARTLTVRSGQEIGGIDFALKPVPAFRVSGQVTDANGPVANLPIRMTAPGTGDYEIDRSGPSASTITDGAGRFILLGVTPGQHVLRALTGPSAGEFGIVEAFSPGDGAVISTPREMFISPPAPPREPTLFVTTPVGVADADVDDVTLVVRNGVRLSGRVEFAGARDQPGADQLKGLRIQVELREGGMSDWEFDMTGKVTPNKQFETAELPPGSYFVRVSNPPDGWSLASVTAGGRDLSDVPVVISDKAIDSLVVKFTDKPSALAGTVRLDARDDWLDEAVVLVFPADRTHWTDYGVRPRRLQQSSVSKEGAYGVIGLPPGEYLVAAVRDDFLTDWRDPAFLAKVALVATRVTMAVGEQKTQGLVMERVR